MFTILLLILNIIQKYFPTFEWWDTPLYSSQLSSTHNLSGINDITPVLFSSIHGLIASQLEEVTKTASTIMLTLVKSKGIRRSDFKEELEDENQDEDESRGR